MTESRISSAQSSSGIAGLSRYELHDVQSFIEALRKVNSGMEGTSEQVGGLERAPDQSKYGEGRIQHHAGGARVRPLPIRVLILRAAKRSAKSKKSI